MGLFDTLEAALAGGNPLEAFEKITQNASADQLSQGLAAAMRSDSTPAFGEMVSQLFGQSNSAQQAGVLNQLLALLGPAALSSAAGGALGRVMTPGATEVTPEQASEITPEEMHDIAAHAEQAHPGAIDAVSQFYAQHSGLIKMLGGAALTIALAKMKEHSSAA